MITIGILSIDLLKLNKSSPETKGSNDLLHSSGTYKNSSKFTNAGIFYNCQNEHFNEVAMRYSNATVLPSVRPSVCP